MSGPDYVWPIILSLGLTTYLIRFSFLGLLGERRPAPLVETLLRYVPTAVIPALIAPMVMFPAATGGAIDPARLLAAGAAFAVGAAARSIPGAIIAGMGSLWGLQAIGL